MPHALPPLHSCTFKDELNEGPANLELCVGVRAGLCAATVVSDAACSLLLPPTAVTALSPQQRAANCWRRYEKPCDATKKKVKLFTIKPLFLHVSMSGAPPHVHSVLFQPARAIKRPPLPRNSSAVRSFAL